MKTVFQEGQQPCQNFHPSRDHIGTIVHECLWPFNGSRPCCSQSHGGTVSFCQNCNRDHHSGGYETCASEMFGSGNQATDGHLSTTRRSAAP